jgi:hypothetical protein
MNPICEPGQIYASTHKNDQQQGHNQRRAVLAIEDYERRRYSRATDSYTTTTVRRACLTCDGNGGKMVSHVTLRPDGTLPRHVLVAEADPRLKALGETFRGIPTREAYGYKDKLTARNPKLAADPVWAIIERDLADEVYAALLWPRKPDGAQNPKVEVTLHQDALVALAERLLTLIQTVEQSAMVADFTSPYERPQRP